MNAGTKVPLILGFRDYHIIDPRRLQMVNRLRAVGDRPCLHYPCLNSALIRVAPWVTRSTEAGKVFRQDCRLFSQMQRHPFPKTLTAVVGELHIY
jgi:hypothetical protein